MTKMYLCIFNFIIAAGTFGVQSRYSVMGEEMLILKLLELAGYNSARLGVFLFMESINVQR